jgi:hypothetical protein
LDPDVLKGIIAAVAAVLGAIVAGVYSQHNARVKLKELQITYEQRLQESYLANARQYTTSLYVPLALALARLSSSFEEFNRQVNAVTGSVDREHEERFRGAILLFYETFNSLTERGADAFLTTELEEGLRSFTSFLRASATAAEPVIKAVYKYRLSIAQFGISGQKALEWRGRAASRWRSNPINVDFLGSGFTYQANEVLAAPLNSPDFAQRFSIDVPTLKRLIKEVTLGAHTAGVAHAS